MLRSSELSLFGLFLVLNLIATSINHIDDTDETYGYWEPLHYLAFGQGMQTWEYSPAYAIRTYSFIYPFYIIVSTIKLTGMSKQMIFYMIKSLLGTFAAIAETRFISTLHRTVGLSVSANAAVFLFLSPGVFFASTSYLPSAVCMSLLMLSISSWLENRFLNCIIWGSIAVLCTGWPFVGLLFLPLGLHMIVHSYASVIYSKGTHFSAFRKVAQLAGAGIVVIALIQGSVLLLDYKYYNRWTSPTWNILLYNAIGGSGDELYGIEPVSYYAKNLLLNMGVAWVLVLLSPLVFVVSAVLRVGRGYKSTDALLRGAVLCFQALLWLGILFSRPHKEERFLYPIYPLLAFSAGATLDQILRIITRLCPSCAAAPGHTATQQQVRPSNSSSSSGRAGTQTAAGIGAGTGLKTALLTGCMLLSLAMFTCRLVSNTTNFGGYIKLWSVAGKHIATMQSTQSLHSQDPARVCTGSEWYQFSSHFFLPEGARLDYLSDGFGGVLPQHFAPQNGTFAPPLQEFNNRNREVKERYISLAQCDYLVLLMDDNKPEQDSPLRSQLRDGQHINNANFRQVTSERVISAAYSPSALLRAYFIPGRSPKSVKFQEYTLFERVQN